MVTILTFLAALALIILAFIGLAFFVSSIWEREKRATIYAGIQFFILLTVVVLFFYLGRVGFFGTRVGFWLLAAGLILVLFPQIALLLPNAMVQ